MAWVFLGIAGLLEVVWAYFMKVSEGFTKPVESVATIVTMGISFWLLSLAMKELPLGTAYAVWVGIGATITVAYGMFTGEEPVSVLRILLLGVIVAGVIGLKLLH